MTLIQTDELANHIDDPNWVVVDCRADLLDHAKGRSEFELAHIPGAQFADLETDLSDPPGKRGRHPLPSKERFCDFLSELGVGENSTVVAYDQANGMFACRFWWMVRWVGHADVRVLDGGLRTWRESGRDLTDTIQARSPSEFTPRPSLTKTVAANQVLEHQGILIDARTEDRFRGENEMIDHKAGHIPGAICRPFPNNLTDDERFNTSSSQFGEIDRTENIVCYCGSGVTATHNIFALLLAGYPEPSLYPGSWSEWIEDDSRPVEM